MLVEVYRSDTAPAEHKKTEHYQKWRETVADLMAEDRHSMKYSYVFLDDMGWS